MSTALVPMAPTSLAEAETFAEKLSRSQLLPAALRGKPADVLVTLIAGHELGLSPMQAVRSIHVIEGKPTLAADLMVALCKRNREVCEWFRLVESGPESATYETQRAGEPGPTRMTWTIQQASKAGLTGKQNWRNHPDAMLRARCSSALARAVYPDLVGGLYETGEAAEIEREPDAIDVVAEPVTDANREPVAVAPSPEDDAARAAELEIDKATLTEDIDTLRAIVADLIGASDDRKEARRAWYVAHHCAARSNSKNPIDAFMAKPHRERQHTIAVARKELDLKAGTGTMAEPDWMGGKATTEQVAAYVLELRDKGIHPDIIDAACKGMGPDAALVALAKLDPELRSKP